MGPLLRFNVIGDAWRLYRRHWVVWSLAMLIVLIGDSIVSTAVFAILDVGRGGGHAGFRFPMTPGEGALQYILATVISGFFLGGMIRMASNQIRGRAPRLEDLFTITDVWLDLLLGATLYAVATFLGGMLCVVPGLVASGVLMFTTPLIVEARLPATGALIQSWNVLKSQWLTATVFQLVLFLLAGSGILLCFVGIFFTGPLYSLSLAILYHEFFRGNSFTAWKKPVDPFFEV
jgi:uncharacterized membrane protein